MSYREKLVLLNKNDCLKYQDLTFSDLQSLLGATDFVIFQPENCIELVTLSYVVDIKSPPFYSKFNLSEYGYRFDIIDKSILKKIIENHADCLYDYFDNQLQIIQETNNEKKIFSTLHYIYESKKNSWKLNIGKKTLRPYSLIENKEELYLKDRDGHISCDFSAEYNIFNLVFIYNTFDWDNNFLILSGW